MSGSPKVSQNPATLLGQVGVQSQLRAFLVFLNLELTVPKQLHMHN